MNLNRCACWGSSIPWHCDNEPLFGKLTDPKVIASMSLGSLVEFRVRRRGKEECSAPIQFGHGELFMVQLKRIMSTLPPRAAGAPGEPYPQVAIPAHRDL